MPLLRASISYPRKPVHERKDADSYEEEKCINSRVYSSLYLFYYVLHLGVKY